MKTTTTNEIVLFKELELDQKLELIEEYDRLEFTARREWRDQHGATGSLLTYYRRRYLAGKPKAKLQRVPVFEAELVEDEVSLADAILAFEVKRDHMNEFIEEMKRIRKGGR